MTQMRATRKRTNAIIQIMEKDDSRNMLQAAEQNGIPGDIAAEWYQEGKKFSSSYEVCKDFYYAVYRLLMEREMKQNMAEIREIAITRAKAGDKNIQKLLKQKGIDYLQ